MGSYAQKAVFKRVYKAPKQSEVIILAKDGTARGGARPGSGPKRKALTEKISAGKTAQVIELPEGASLEGVDMPPVKEYMKAKQKNGGDLCAEEIFAETWVWLKKVGCTDYVNTQLVNQYAMSVARQIQCEQCISEYGFLAKHPTTGASLPKSLCGNAPTVYKTGKPVLVSDLSDCAGELLRGVFGINPADDDVERLLRSRKGT